MRKAVATLVGVAFRQVRRYRSECNARGLSGLGKPAKVVITACMQKLLTLLNALVRNQTHWIPQASTVEN